MDNYLTINCDDCGVIFNAIARIDTILTKYAKNKYVNDRYLLKKSI